MREDFTGPLASSVLGDTQDLRHWMIGIIKRGLQSGDTLLFWNRWELASEMVRDQILVPCSDSPMEEVFAWLPPAQTSMPMPASVARPYP